MRARKIFDTLYRYFLNGLIIIAPIAITLMIVAKTLQFLEGIIGDFIPLHIPGIGITTGISLIIICGWLSSYIFYKNWIKYAEQFLSSIPIVKTVFKIIKQVQSAIFENKHAFKDAVLVPYPNPETYALGFVVASPGKKIAECLPENYICVFLPFSLNMTTGTNLFIDKNKIRYLDISTESALQFFLSAGAVMPGELPPEKR